MFVLHRATTGSVSEVQAVYPWLTVPPYTPMMDSWKKHVSHFLIFFKCLSGCADVQMKLNFYFKTFAMICGHISVWWGMTSPTEKNGIDRINCICLLTVQCMTSCWHVSLSSGSSAAFYTQEISRMHASLSLHIFLLHSVCVANTVKHSICTSTSILTSVTCPHGSVVTPPKC